MNQLGLDAYRCLCRGRAFCHRIGGRECEGARLLRPPDRPTVFGGNYSCRHALSLGSAIALQEQGGWMNRDTSYRLGGEYAQVVGERLSDRVGMWMPLNEPVVHTLYGHASEFTPPDWPWGGSRLSKPHITSCSGMASLSKRFGQPDARTSESPRTMLRCVPLRIRRKT